MKIKLKIYENDGIKLRIYDNKLALYERKLELCNKRIENYNNMLQSNSENTETQKEPISRELQDNTLGSGAFSKSAYSHRELRTLERKKTKAEQRKAKLEKIIKRLTPE